jgi:hypothetical protein
MTKQKTSWNIGINRCGGYYFIKPQPNRNAKDLASQLLEFPDVEEVILTSGNFGYIVKTSKGQSQSDSSIRDFLGKAAEGFGAAEVHYTLKKHIIDKVRA